MKYAGFDIQVITFYLLFVVAGGCLPVDDRDEFFEAGYAVFCCFFRCVVAVVGDAD